jgi:hypothetical protein
VYLIFCAYADLDISGNYQAGSVFMVVGENSLDGLFAYTPVHLWSEFTSFIKGIFLITDPQLTIGVLYDHKSRV